LDNAGEVLTAVNGDAAASILPSGSRTSLLPLHLIPPIHRKINDRNQPIPLRQAFC
jgi:hypothetical protein